jgi:hypothetical protein
MADPSQKTGIDPDIELSDVLLTMDVVDTIRYDRSIVERELGTEAADRAMVTKVRNLYADQGLSVSDEIIAEAVAALREERFAYKPPKQGLNTLLARIYVQRGFWTKTLVGGLVILIGAILIYQWAYVGPARRRQAKSIQVIEVAWQQFQQSRPAADIAPTGKQIYEAAKKAAADGQTDSALQQAQTLEQLTQLPRQLEIKRKQVQEEAREKSVREQAQNLFRQGRQALTDGRIDDAQQSYRALSQLLNRLQQEFILQIVSRPDEPSGVWRIPADNASARNYYVIVEAVTPRGDRLSLPITSEEDGQTHTVNKWGLRVNAKIFDKIRQDKMDDGIIQNHRFGLKKRGYLRLEYLVPTTGDAITKW